MSDGFKIINATKEEACRTAEADAIRAKTGGTTPLTYDFANGKGFAEEIANIPSGTEITDGIVVKSVNAQGYVTEVEKYGDLHTYEFGSATTDYHSYIWGYLSKVKLMSNQTIVPDACFAHKFITEIDGIEKITSCGRNSFAALPFDELYLPNLERCGYNAFAGNTAASVILPKLTEMGGVEFQYCAPTLKTVQLGSAGHGLNVAKVDRPFYGNTQADLTVTAYCTGASADLLLAKIRGNATNATIIIKASENTTYGGNSYLAGETMITSTP